MRRGWVVGGVCFATMVLANACGRQLPHQAAVDARSAGRDADATDDRAAAHDCAAASDAAIQASDTGDGWCGGEITIAGLTPLGSFCPTRVRADLSLGDCARSLFIVLAEADDAGQQLGFSLAYDRSRGPWLGTYQTTASLSSGGVRPSLTSFPTTVEVTASDDPFADDGGLSSGTSPPMGQIRLRLMMPTSSGTVSGTLLARFCRWSLCI
jgi:hypothetical protein